MGNFFKSAIEHQCTGLQICQLTIVIPFNTPTAAQQIQALGSAQIGKRLATIYISFTAQ
jgi:hypothetical protein